MNSPTAVQTLSNEDVIELIATDCEMDEHKVCFAPSNVCICAASSDATNQ